jgi:uncharacterized membrane protein YadS
MIALRSLGVLSAETLEAAAVLQDIMLGSALFGLGSSVRFSALLTTGLRGTVMALCSWLLIAALGYAAVLVVGLG